MHVFELFLIIIVSMTIITKETMTSIRFCVGDQFYLLDNKILCGSDYEERMLFASLQVFIIITVITNIIINIMIAIAITMINIITIMAVTDSSFPGSA